MIGEILQSLKCLKYRHVLEFHQHPNKTNMAVCTVTPALVGELQRKGAQSWLTGLAESGEFRFSEGHCLKIKNKVKGDYENTQVFPLDSITCTHMCTCP